MLQVTATHYERPLQGHTSIRLQFPAMQLQIGQRGWLSGPSGSGKSTLLNVIAGLLPAPTGCVQWDHTDPHALSRSKQTQWRARHIGVLSQTPNLLNQLSVLDNLRAAAWAAQLPWDHSKALAALTDLNVAPLASRLALHLSRGQAQRVALARAVLLGQGLLLADEPTANLDDTATQAVLSLLKQQSERGVTILMASHDQRVANWAQTLIVMPQTTAQPHVI